MANMKIFVIFACVFISTLEATFVNIQLQRIVQNNENFTSIIIVTSNETEVKKFEKPHIHKIKFRYIPFMYKQHVVNNSDEETCLEPSSDDFPSDIFNLKQKRSGAVVFHFLIGIYCFTLLAVVCNDYFLPSVECICDKLDLSQDVAAATFMATATSAPEFFVNVVATFVTESDMGVGTIVGSSMFNTLGVAALGGLACKNKIKLDWWPITRDSVIYILTIIMLVLMCKDEKIDWYEAMTLLIFYVVYFFIMWQNKNIYNSILRMYGMLKRSNSTTVLISEHGSVATMDQFKDATVVKVDTEPTKELSEKEKPVEVPTSLTDCEDSDEPLALLVWPSKSSKFMKAWWIYSWPIRLLLTLTIPDCRKYKRIFPLTFIMCVVWIGTNSYMVSWMITIIGETLAIPDFVMGVTFLAAGGCLPEAISIIILSRKGHGGMGVSNSLGANTMVILLSLGLPWFIKTMILRSQGGVNYIQMDSDSLFYTIIALIVAVFALYITVSTNGYYLSRRVGIILIICYIIFLSMAISLELFLYYDGKLKPCES